MIELKIQNKSYKQEKHPNPERRCKDCDLREWCFAQDFMMACTIFDSESVFKQQVASIKRVCAHCGCSFPTLGEDTFVCPSCFQKLYPDEAVKRFVHNHHKSIFDVLCEFKKG